MSNYGLLTDISKAGNILLGDQTGRTISRRTSHGLQNTLAPNISDSTAEDIVHIGMIVSFIAVFSKKAIWLCFGFALIFFLIFLYFSGKTHLVKNN